MSALIECSVCLQTMKNPKMTVCGHSFCDTCITSSLEYTQKCPRCNANCFIKDLRINYDLKSIIEERRNSKKLILEIFIIGDSGTGKTCIMDRFSTNTFIIGTNQTIGVGIKSRTIELEDEYIKFNIWDSAGQERFRSITSSYYKKMNGIFIVYDITNFESFESIPKWIQEIKRYANEETNIILVGNKCDLEQSRQVERRYGEELSRQLGVSFFETSACSSINIEEMFILMAKEIRNKFYFSQKEVHTSNVSVRLSQRRSSNIKSRNCCSN